MVRIVVADGDNVVTGDFSWTYDCNDNVTSLTVKIKEGNSYRTETRTVTYNSDQQPMAADWGSLSQSVSYDGWGRIGDKVLTHTVNNLSTDRITTAYTYGEVEEGDTTYTTTQVCELSNTFGNTVLTHEYEYDANGNIVTDTVGNAVTEYTYDGLNQLLWEKNAAALKAWACTYDLGGNILTKTEYDYDPVTGQTTNGVTIAYTYGDTAWHDLLTGWNNQSITYDGIGNPTSYRGWTMSWQGGRQLAGMSDGTSSLSFAYNEAGLRTEKTVNGGNNQYLRQYLWNGSTLMADIGPNDAFYFRYDGAGELIGYVYKDGNAEKECLLVNVGQGTVPCPT